MTRKWLNAIYRQASTFTRDLKRCFFVFLTILVLLGTYLSTVEIGMDHSLGASPRHMWAMAIALSEMEYGSSNYTGYVKVQNALLENGLSGQETDYKKFGRSMWECLRDPDLLNTAIHKALTVSPPASGLGKTYLFREDKGEIIYHKWAFFLFGYNIESLFKLYWLLLSASVMCFFVTFYKRHEILNILLLLSCAHFVVAMSAYYSGADLNTITDPRFIPVLAAFPAFHIAFLILGKVSLGKVRILCCGIQVFLLIFVFFTRSSAVYLILFLSLVWFVPTAVRWGKQPTVGVYVLNAFKMWPLMLTFVGFLFMKLHLALALEYPYTPATRYHLFWHAAILGLGAHPDAHEKYGLYKGDSSSLEFAYHLDSERLMPFNNDAYEAVLKEGFLKISYEDPIFVVESYVYKLRSFFDIYFGEVYGANRSLASLALVLTVISGSLIGYGMILEHWRSTLYIVVTLFGLSLLPCLFALPNPWIISDPALYLSFIFYFLLSGVASLFFMIIFRKSRI